MRHVDERDADLLLEGLQLDLEPLAELGVQGAERLVEQQHGRVQDQRARQRDALLLPARELAGPALLEPGQSHQLQSGGDPVFRLLLGRALVPQAEGDVLLHGQVGEEGVVLEHGVDVALVRWRLRHVDAVEQDLALGRFLEAGDHAQRRRLATARRAQQREELAWGDVQVDACDGHEVAETLHEVDELDLSACHGARSLAQATFGGSRRRGLGVA